MRTLDVGCGKKKRQGSIGIDRSINSDADVICDLEKFPWPFKDNTFDLILLSHVLEHLDDTIKVIEEIWRVASPKAKILIDVPHFSHPDSFRDPTHKHYFTFYSFDYFTGDPFYPKYTSATFKILKRSLKATSGINRFIANRLKPRIYEERFARIFPAYGIEVILEPIK